MKILIEVDAGITRPLQYADDDSAVVTLVIADFDCEPYPSIETWELDANDELGTIEFDEEIDKLYVQQQPG